MRFEFLVEGKSDATTLSILLPKIIGKYRETPHIWKIHKHRGLGKLPEPLTAPPSGRDPTLLHNLPSKLRSYGNEQSPDLLVVVLIDLDDRPDCISFKNQLQNILNTCDPMPRTLFRIAIDEIEAWFLSDPSALLSAYPDSNLTLLTDYIPDQRIGSWEKLAEVVYPGGLESLLIKGKRSSTVLEQKRKWAAKITPYLNVETTPSPSLQAFRDGLRRYLP